MPKVKLTDRFITTRKPAAPGKRDVYYDYDVPGMALRVTDRGHRSFVLIARYPLQPNNPTPRALGTYGAITLAEVRERAKTWLGMIEEGIDPKVDLERRKAAAKQKMANTFGAVAEQFLERHAVKLAKVEEAKRIVKSEFVKRWAARPIGDITPAEIAAAIRAIVNRNAPYQAHNAFGYLHKLFNWAIGTGEYGTNASPLERLHPAELIGKREARDYVLENPDLRRVWDAAGMMGYPYGPLFRLLILTGQREREVAEMRWREVDLKERLWTIPATRMKGGRAHEVPLAPEAVGLLESLPRFTRGDAVFTATAGEKPVDGFSKCKARLDKLSSVTGWKIHDLRRTVRTRLSGLPIEDHVRELIIAHAQNGLHKIYDLHRYRTKSAKGSNSGRSA